MAFIMRDFPGFSSLRLPLAAILGVCLAACTSGGGGNGDASASSSGSSSSVSSCGSTVTLSGHVTAGAPLLSAAVVVKDANSVTRVATTNTTDGSYSVNVGCLSAPLLVEAAGVVAGRQVVLHSFLTSVSGSTPTLNVTPLTDGVLALVGGEDPLSYFAGQNFAALTTVNNGALNSTLQSILAPVISAVGVSPAPNFFTDSISPTTRSGLDEILELIKVVPLPASNSNGVASGEEVQISSRLDSTQRVLLTFSNGAIVSSSSSAASGASIAMAAADLQGFNTNGSSNFGGIDSLITILNAELAVSAGALQDGEYAPGYENDGYSSTPQGASPSYRTPVIEDCNGSAQTCRVRLGYVWSSFSSTTSGSSIALGGYDYYYDTLKLGSNGQWAFYGNRRPYSVLASYRFLQPNYPTSVVNPDPAAFAAPAQPAVIEQLAININTSPLLSNGSGPVVQSVTVSTVGANAVVQPLATLTSANQLRGTTSNPVPLTLVLPLTEASAAQLNAANGHIQVQVALSQCGSATPNNCAPVDLYVNQALDPGSSNVTNQALSTLPFPSLLNNSLDGFLNWTGGATLSLDTSSLSASVPTSNPATVPGSDVFAVFGYNSDPTQTTNIYFDPGELLPVPGNVQTNVVLLTGGTIPAAAVDRKLLLGTEDDDQNTYVTAYCVGTNVALNCQ